MPLVLALGLVCTTAAGAASGPVAPPPLPSVTAINPPATIRGERIVWVVRGKRLGAIDRVDVGGGGVRGAVVRASDESLEVAVTTAPDAEPGYRDVRFSGADGISNPRLIRVDHLKPVPEQEPNDNAGQATPLPVEAAAVGTLDARDVDHFRFTAARGTCLTIDLEARRLGAPVAPVVSVSTGDGRALLQARETPGVDGDCRFAFTAPADGTYVVQVRDNLYRDSGGSPYRLRVTREPFATGLFPLGGPPGRPLVVTASGGTLRDPVRETVTLPGQPGAIVPVGAFEAPRGSILAPGRVAVGEGAESVEPDALAPELTVNGRLDRPGEVDRYRLPAATDGLEVRLVAAPLGSWLDSVLTVRDAAGNAVAENDDAPGALTGEPGPPNPDSRVELPDPAAGPLTVEVADRFGRGGPEFGYRLTAGPPAVEVAVTLLAEEPDALPPDGPTALPPPPGVVVLRPAAVTTLTARVDRRGRTGPLTLHVEGLPEGVTCDPVAVRRPSTPGRRQGWTSQRVRLPLHTRAGTAAGSGRLRVVARWSREDGREESRLARCPLILARGDAQGTRPAVLRSVTWLPFWVYTGEAGGSGPEDGESAPSVGSGVDRGCSGKRGDVPANRSRLQGGPAEE